MANRYIYSKGIGNLIQITDDTKVGLWNPAHVHISDVRLTAAAPDIIPPVVNPPPPDPLNPPPPITTPPPPVVTPPPPTVYPTPTTPVIVPWPPSGQVVLHIPMAAHQTITYRLIWKSNMNPNKYGFVKINEQPGSAVMPHQLQLFNNGLKKFDSGPNDTGPTGNLCNYPTAGNISMVQMKLNDTLDIVVINGDNQSGQNSDILMDIGLPDRY